MPPESSVADSLREIYVSVTPAGENFIVNQGKWFALFDKEGKPLTGFSYLYMTQGAAAGQIVAHSKDYYGWCLLNVKGEFLVKFDKPISFVDTVHQLYRYKDTYRSKNDLSTGTVYNDSGRVVLQYNDSKTYYLGLCGFGDGYKSGVKDTFGRVVIPDIYDRVRISEWGIGALKNDTAYIFNKKGAFIFSTPAKDVQMLKHNVLALKMKGLWCLKDNAGKNLTSFKYTSIKEIENGNYIVAGGYILDYQGKEVAKYEDDDDFYYANGWYYRIFQDDVWDEHFRPVFEAGKYNEIEFIGSRFIKIIKDYGSKDVQFYDREKRKFSKLKIEEELPGDAYLLMAKDSVHRFILKEKRNLKFPYFTNIKPIENFPFLMVDNGPKKTERDYRDIAMMVAALSGPGTLYGLLDTNLKVVLPLKYSRIEVINNHLVAGWDEQNNLFCLVNEKGKILFRFNDADAKVDKRQLMTGLRIKGKYLLLDSLGNILFRGQYPPALLYPDLKLDRQPGMPRLMLCLGSSNDYGLYDLQGHQILPDEYYPVSQQMPGVYALKKKDSVYFVNNNGRLLYKGRGFSGMNTHILKSYALLFKNESGKWGVWDVHGKEILPFVYDTVGEGGAGYYIGNNKNHILLDDYGHLNDSFQLRLPEAKLPDAAGQAANPDSLFVLKNGKLVSRKTNAGEDIRRYLSFNNNGIALVKSPDKTGIPSGIYNHRLDRIAPYVAGYRNQFGKNAISISDSALKNIAVIDTNGKILIPFFPKPAVLRMADSQIFAAYNDGSAFCFQKNEQQEYYSIPVKLVPDKNGYAVISGETNRYWHFVEDRLRFERQNGSLGLVNRNGRFLTDSLITDIIQKDGCLLIKRAGKWGLMNSYQFNYIVPPTADMIESYRSDFVIHVNGLEGVYSTALRLYFPPVYQKVFEPSTLQNNFLVVKQNDRFGIIDANKKNIVSGLDSIRTAFRLNGLIAFKNGKSYTVALNDNGVVQLVEAKNIPMAGFDGQYGDVVITRTNDRFGLYDNVKFRTILPDLYDAIDREEGCFIVWKYKPDKHQGIDSTIVVGNNGEILLRFKGLRNPVSKYGLLFVNGTDSTPVLKDNRIIIPAGFSLTPESDGKFFILTNGRQSGIIGSDGDWRIPLFSGTINEEYLIGYDYMLGTIVSGKKHQKKKYFLITEDGKRTDKQLYDSISFEANGRITFKKGRKTGLLRSD